jgi:hypothetical protein
MRRTVETIVLPGVAQDLLVGKPLCVHLPLRGVSVGPWSFQVPEIARMRYIR